MGRVAWRCMTLLLAAMGIMAAAMVLSTRTPFPRTANAFALAVPAPGGVAHAGNLASTADAASLRAIYQGPPSQWPAAWRDADADGQELAPAPPPPREDIPAQRALGERLFFDARLSAGGAVSCASCHRPSHGWASPDARSAGHASRRGPRNAPGLMAAVQMSAWGWDGRHDTLVAASLFALTDLAEMANPSLTEVVQRLQADSSYVQAFRGMGATITPRAVGEALSSYVEGLDTPTALDEFLRGDHSRLTDEQVLGLHLFRTKARCLNCHGGPALSDGRFHNLGLVGFDEPDADLGRYTATGHASDAGTFRTPSLRHVVRTAPYMHDGAFRTLTGVIRLYARGGGEVFVRSAEEAAQPVRRHAATVSPHLQPLALTAAEVQALAAFLEAL